ncbi:protein RIC-3b [Genypterus blacodes]|uniref:protein RIC-3b n=1 Tax=Genypterus blacodes TaxID=154954 RepID=UPI003F76EA77
MAMSTFQKVTLTTCLLLCVALLLPKTLLSRGRKDAAERPDGAGRYPPLMHRQSAPEPRGQRAAGSQFSRAHNTEAIARAKGAGTGAGTGGKSNLAGQIIPVYGFGILMYILYILFKITSKGNKQPTENRFPSVRSENMKRKITDFELAQLQEKLRETELVMENIVSNAQHSPDRVKGVMADQEESLLQQLTEITRVMQEGQMVEGLDPEKKTQSHWEDYPEEPHQQWERSHCCHHHGDKGDPQPEGEAETTEADCAETPEDLTGGGEEEQRLEELHKAAAVGAEGEVGVKEREGEEEEGQGGINLGIPDEDLAGVLQELELTLEMTSVMEQEKMETFAQPAETSGHVRRRNKKRRARKDSH